MDKQCIYCSKFYNHKKNDRMCQKCKEQYEIAFENLKTNKALQGVMLRLTNQ